MDIILLLIVAGWIIFRLFSIIGQDLGGNTDAFKGQDPTLKPKDEVKAEDETVIELDTKSKKSEPIITDAVRKKIVKLDESFIPEQFVEGAKGCFSIVIESFAVGDKDKLKELLSPNTYTVFSDAIDAREQEGQRSVEEVVAFIKTKISKATIKGSQLDVSVDFVTDQINVVYDDQDRIIQGHPNDIVRLDDTWVFTRDMDSQSANWYLKETQ